MVNISITLTNGEYAGGIEKLKEFVVDGRYTKFQELINNCDSFYYDGNELLIYKEGTIIYSGVIHKCSEEYFVTELYGEFDLVYENKMEYNPKVLECLAELHKMRNRFQKNWNKQIDHIYRKYGVDFVDMVINDFELENRKWERRDIRDYYMQRIKVKQNIVDYLCKTYELSDRVRIELNEQILICEGLGSPLSVELIQELVFLPFNRMLDRISKHKYA